MRFGTGSYNVRHSEGLNPETLKKSSENKNKFKCTVYFLDCTERVFEIDKSSIGLELLEKVFDHLELIEKDFFSLQFLSFLDSEAEHPRMKWLDPKKSIKKQMVCHPFDLYFKVKFYADPIKLCEEYTRYHFFLQVKKDITEGRLFCPDSSAALLASYSVQSELGDYNSEEQDETYSEHIKILPNQSDTLIENVKSLHQLHHGQSPAQAEANFLDHAKRLDFYGVDTYEAILEDEMPLLVGVNSYGLCLFQETQKINAYPWCSIMKLTFRKKLFNVVIRIINDHNEEEDKLFVFNVMNSALSCKLLFKSCMEHHIFFRLIVPPLEPSKSLFSLGSRYRYSGRTEYQSIVETKRRARVERAFMRANSKTGFLRSTIAIGSRNDSSTSSRTTTFSQPNTATTTVSTMSNNLDSAFDNADVEYCVKTSMNNGHYHPKIDEDNISNNSAKGSTYNTWTNGNICNVKRTASFLRRNFSLKRGGLNMFTSNSSSSSISSLFMKMIPKGSTSAADIATNKTDTIDEQFMRILRHRPIQEIGATHNHSDLSESLAPTPNTTLTRRSNGNSHYSPPRTQSSSGTNMSISTAHPMYSDNGSKLSLRNDINGHDGIHNALGVDGGSTRRRTSPRETTFGIMNDTEENGCDVRDNGVWQGHLKENYVSGVSGTSPYNPYNSNVQLGNEGSLSRTLNNSSASSTISRSPTHSNQSAAINNPVGNPKMTMHATQGNGTLNNGYRKNPVSNGPSNSSSSTSSSSSSAYGTANSYSSNGSSGIATQNSNSSAGTLTRPIHGSTPVPPNASPYKSSPRINHQQNGLVLNQMNGYSPRSSVASYSSYASSNGHPASNNQPYNSTQNGNSKNSNSIKQLSSHSPIRQTLSQRRSPKVINPINCNLANGIYVEENLVVVRLKADVLGQFGYNNKSMRPEGQQIKWGFNIKGGADQDHPVIVSRIAEGSPAAKCYPRLNEGDEIVMINGKDISHFSHEKIVQFIRNAKDSSNGELTLNIKPNVYRYGENEDADMLNNIIEVTHVSDKLPKSDMLKQSLRLVKDNLKNGKAVEHFDLLYRRNPSLTVHDAKLPENLNRNRYRDIMAYDFNRIRLQSSHSGDYINASSVNMEIPSSGIINRYIACQGPLPHTSKDFWLMVWEQSVNTIVMLTTLIENGRIKCHQYWPRVCESHDYGNFVIKCKNERETENCVYRDLTLMDVSTKEMRSVTQLQYITWPDHGVPEDPKNFIEFVTEVRKSRHGNMDPILIHCSAGIGRTGVLTLLDTAASMIEANEPVYPVEIVKSMRDQRAMMIQTNEQYIFACESILKAYESGIFKPLA